MRLLPIVLLFMAVPGDASAQQFVCSTVRYGDTATGLALRLTNSAENRNALWFQILDPTTSRFIPKSAYHSIRPGWKVCIARDAAGSWPKRQIDIPLDRAKPEAGRLFDRLAAIDPAYAWMMAVAVLAPLLATPAAKKHFDKRRAMLDSMSEFAAVFVLEFAQPLPRRHATDQPIRARLRCAPYRARLEILLAPNTGHTYPNLSDHRKNLEYDIERVQQLVPNQPFIRGEVYSRGDWVVIPFQVPTQAAALQEGAK